MPATVHNITAHRRCLSSSVSSLASLALPPPSWDSCSLFSPPLGCFKSLAEVLRLSPTFASSRPAASIRIHRSQVGKAFMINLVIWPAKRPSNNLTSPRNMMLAPERAPKRYWAARPPMNSLSQCLIQPKPCTLPLPWHTGIAPNQQLTMLIAMTLSPSAVVDGVLTCGSRSAARNETAITEFNVVSGSCPIPASRVPTPKSLGDGTKVVGCHIVKPGSGFGGFGSPVPIRMRETYMKNVAPTMPMRSMIKANGTRLDR